MGGRTRDVKPQTTKKLVICFGDWVNPLWENFGSSDKGKKLIERLKVQCWSVLYTMVGKLVCVCECVCM